MDNNNFNNGYNQYGYQQPQAPYNQGPPQNNSNGVAVASLVLGILAVITACFIFMGLGLGVWLSLVLAILATILGACSKNKTGPFAGQRPSVGTAGLVLGIIMLVIDVVLILIAIIVAIMAVNELSRWRDFY